jgi:hypothetical protein
LGPGVEGDWELETAGILGSEPPALADADIFASIILGSGSWGLFFR